MYDIAPRPPQEFEVRVCIFNCKNIVMMDFEGTCDTFFKCFFDEDDAQETDTHFRCQDGKPDFQYRLIHKIAIPRKNYKYKIQGYDRDFLKSNDILGENNINLKGILEDC